MIQRLRQQRRQQQQQQQQQRRRHHVQVVHQFLFLSLMTTTTSKTIVTMLLSSVLLLLVLKMDVTTSAFHHYNNQRISLFQHSNHCHHYRYCHHYHHHGQQYSGSTKLSFTSMITTTTTTTKGTTRTTTSNTKRTLRVIPSLRVKVASSLLPSSSSSSSLYASTRRNDDDAVMAKTTTITSSSSLTSPPLTSSSSSVTMINVVGEDSAYFDWKEQSIVQWIQFTGAVTAILSFIAYIWVVPFGLHGGDIFVETIQSNIFYTTTDPAITISIMLIVFAIAHSGLAALRNYGETIIGPRFYRVLFATISLPLSLCCISYFVNHGHDGIQLWNIVPSSLDRDTIQYQIIHTLLYGCNFISFLFLYPATFNLLEVAAITPPQIRLWNTGIIRITRHPQAFGQLLWCIAHTVYLGTSTAVAASIILIIHHIFACYHGDYRLRQRHGTSFDYISNTTSIIPFAAILDGRQQLPNDYYTEYIRLPYAIVIIGTIGAYLAHPYMQAGAALLNW
jgi:zeta-carotene isomerase